MSKYKPGDDVTMMQNPSHWPAWPVLPLRHCQAKDLTLPAMPRTAIMTESFGVYDLNLYALPVTQSGWEAKLIKKYNSAEEVFAAGWRVD